MKRVKIHLLIIIALVINALNMGLYAYRHYTNGATGYGILFSVLCLFLIGLTAFGVIRNQKLKES